MAEEESQDFSKLDTEELVKHKVGHLPLVFAASVSDNVGLPELESQDTGI